MKIKKIQLHNYKQFKDLTLDLTYPKGHEKAGEPLDKICIIGQSGTGKTNLLDVIKNRMTTSRANVLLSYQKNSNNEDIYFSGTDRLNKVNSLAYNSDDISMKQRLKALFNEVLPHLLSFFVLYLTLRFVLLVDNAINLPQILIAIFSAFVKFIEIGVIILIPFLALVILIAILVKKMIGFTGKQYKEIKNEKSYINIDEGAWYSLKDSIDKYEENQKELQAKLYNQVSQKILSIEQAQLEEEDWQKKNTNILESISEILNSVLYKFNLEIGKIDPYQKSYNDLIIHDLSNNKIIKYDDVSTGTKNLIATFIPLKIHNPKDSIILIDEPENSFYPDIQRKLTELYMEVGENNQLVFATHSPLIASSFEPWEIVELKFDKDNQIYREEYYDKTKDNHVNNYVLDPRMLTWTGILTNIFDLKEDSNFAYREKKLMEYIRLEQELRDITDKTLKKEKFEELMKLSDLLGLSGNEKD